VHQFGLPIEHIHYQDARNHEQKILKTEVVKIHLHKMITLKDIKILFDRC
jgi:hypothetical protein